MAVPQLVIDSQQSDGDWRCVDHGSMKKDHNSAASKYKAAVNGKFRQQEENNK